MRYLYFTFGGLAFAALAVTLIGSRLPTRHQVTRERAYDTSPEAVFRLLTQRDRFPTWRRGIRAVEMLPDSAGLQRYREVSRDGTITYAAREIQPGKTLTTEIADRNLPFGGRWTYEIIPGADGKTVLRLTEDGEVYNPIFRFVSRFVMGQSATIEAFLADADAALARPR